MMRRPKGFRRWLANALTASRRWWKHCAEDATNYTTAAKAHTQAFYIASVLIQSALLRTSLINKNTCIPCLHSSRLISSFRCAEGFSPICGRLCKKWTFTFWPIYELLGLSKEVVFWLECEPSDLSVSQLQAKTESGTLSGRIMPTQINCRTTQKAFKKTEFGIIVKQQH